MPRQDTSADPRSQPLALADSQRLVHELQVHQFELQAQNEELRQVRAELEASRASYVDLYDLAPAGYCTLSPAGLVLQANLTLAALLGVTRDALVAMPLSRFIAPEDQDRYYRLRQCESGLLADEPASCELRMVRSGGTLFWALAQATEAVGADGVATLRMVFSDITGCKRIQAQLAQSEVNTRAILDSVPSHIAVLDRHGVIVAVNQAWRSFARNNAASPTGPHPDHYVGMNYLGVCQAASGTDAQESALLACHGIQQVMDGAMPSFYLEYACDAPTQQRWFLMAVTPLSGDAHCVVVTHRDISQRKQQERERQELADRVQALSRGLVQAQEQTRRRFARELHDRTSPNLAALRINLDIIANASAQAHGTAGFVNRVEDTRALIEDTTQSIREICAGLHPPALNRGGLLQVVQSYADQFVQRTGVDVRVRCPPAALRLGADLEMALFRIVQEALANCAKHARASTVQIELALDAHPMWLAVADDGVGFARDALPLSGGRTGHGLLNMRETAEFAGAVFSVSSTPGRGTTVRVDLPDQGLERPA